MQGQLIMSSNVAYAHSYSYRALYATSTQCCALPWYHYNRHKYKHAPMTSDQSRLGVQLLSMLLLLRAAAAVCVCVSRADNHQTFFFTSSVTSTFRSFSTGSAESAGLLLLRLCCRGASAVHRTCAHCKKQKRACTNWLCCASGGCLA
jgi:hypothetical protein